MKCRPVHFNKLKNRGLEDCFMASLDGLKKFPETIETVPPQTQVELRIAHNVCNSLRYVSCKEHQTAHGH